MVSPLEIAGIGWAVSPVVSFMVNKFHDYLKKPLKRTYGIEADLEKLKQILPEVQSVVSVAETLKVVNPHQVDLLHKMKEAVYDAEDVVDEFNYRLLEAEAAKEDSVAEKLGAMLLTDGKRLVGTDPLQTSLSKAIKGLEGVDKTAKAFIRACNLEKTADQGQSSGPQQAHTANDRVTTSMKHENKFVGRDADIKNIVDKIKEQADCSSAPPLVISVVGVGGIGKTTLAQQVYNHEEIKSDVFDVKMWVFVENTFNFDTVTKQVLAKIKGKNIDCDSLDTVQDEISKELGSKKFLIILDDVWVDEKIDENKFKNRETWKKFFSTFNQCKGGSTIIVTTRLASVVNMIGDCIKFDLKGLSKKNSRDLFEFHAFDGGVGKSRELEAIGKDIVKKLKGLPLALKVVGGQLRGNHSIEYWEKVLRNTVSAAGNVMDILKLSYDHLPSNLKPCFGYCSLFPKGYRFTENKINQLIHMWIAQGFIDKKDGSDSSLEDIGRGYFDDLCSRSFLQPRKHAWFDRTVWYVMHDLINDLAKFVSREECWQIQSHQSNSPSTLLRHVSVSSTDLHVLNKKIRLDKLRTLLVLNRSEGHVCTQIEDVILASLKGARVLDLSGCCIEQLPETIEQMIHLRYLAFDSTSTLLPETCSRLFNLQVVCMAVHRSKPRGGVICKKGLDGCAPKNMSSLNNLSHVYVPNVYPVEITGHWRIPQFHGTAVFTVNLDNKLIDIHDIGFQGNLAIKNLENAGSKHDDLKPIICQNELMKELKLEWSSAPVSRNNDNDNDNVVLEFLLPPSNLSNLQVCGYRGSKYPFWLKKNYLTSLSSLCLTNCRELRELPPLGQLPRLQELELSELNAVEEISPEFYGTKDAFGFPCLKLLNLGYMQNLIEWSIPEFNFRPLFPLLEEVCITKCSKLRRVPNIFPATEGFKRHYIDGKRFEFAFVSCAPTSSSGGQDTVETIREMISKKRKRPYSIVERNSFLLWKVTEFSGFKFVFGDIESLFQVQTRKLEMLDFHSHPEVVKDLYLFNCKSLLPEVEFTKLSSLERLSIESSERLLWFRDLQEEDVALLPTSLKSLTVKNYRATSNFFSRCFQSLSSLLQLELEDVDLTEGRVIDLHWLTSLTELRIKYCKNLKGINGLEALTCLTTMEIMGCPYLSQTIFQYQFPKPFPSLSTLKISDLYFYYSEDVILDLQHSRELKVLDISCCRGKFKLINCNALTSLTELVIDHCPGLIIYPADLRFLNSSCNLKLKLNDWVPFVECKSLRLPNSFGARQISRLIYTNSSMELLALDSNAMHLLWKWPRNESNPSGEATAGVIPQLWQPPSGIFMMNDITDSNSEDASPCFALSKDNSYVISASGGKISLFNIVTFETITTFMPPPPAATFLAFYPHDNNIIAIGLDDSTIQIYNVRLDKIICHLKGHLKRITGLSFSTVLNVLVSSGADCQICVWSTDGWEKQEHNFLPKLRFKSNISDTCVQFHQDQINFLVVRVSQIAIYETTTLECVRQWVTPGHKKPFISDATFSCDGQLLYATFDDATVYIFDAFNLTIRSRILSAAYLPPNVSPNVYPLVVAAHPLKPNQFAIGLTDGGVHVLEPLGSEGKWGAAQWSQNPSSRSLPINASQTPGGATANEFAVQETKREDKAESRNNDCSKMLGSHLMLSCSSSRPECVKLLRPEKKTESGASTPLMPEELFEDVDFDRLGPDGLRLHDWIIAHGTCASMLEFHPPRDLFGGDNEIVITYEDIKDLLKMNWLNVSVIQLYMLKLFNICQKESIPNIGFMDPERVNATYWGKEKQATITYIAETMQSRQTILAPYFEDQHWVLLVIIPSEGTVYVLDSLYRRDKNYTIKDAFAQAMQGAATFSWITDYPSSPQQIGGFECGYYVMKLMQDIITTNHEFPKGSLPQNYTEREIDSVRQSWIHFFLELSHVEVLKSDHQRSWELPIGDEEDKKRTQMKYRKLNVKMKQKTEKVVHR